jgi:hypothetical protein
VSTTNRYWRVTFAENGELYTVREIDGPGHDEWVVVRADDEEQARIKATRIYCARKKRARVAALQAANRCSCGRDLDGALVEFGRHKGESHKRCATCRERNSSVWRPNHAARVADGTVGQGVAERDEGARVTLNLERQRDRRAEIRLETLIDVRKAWQDSNTVGHFAQWLAREIEALTKSAAA